MDASQKGLNLVAYVRVSTAGQAEDGLGLEVQVEAITEWAAAHGHTVLAVHEDAGISGTADVLDRPGLAAALLAVNDGGAEGLVVYRLDRLARQLFLQEAVIHKLQTGGRAVVSVREPDIDSSDPTRVLMRQMLGAFAEYERALIRGRLMSGRRAKAARGGYAGFGSPGYGWRTEDAELVANDIEQTGLARLVELRTGGASLRDISRTLSAEGHMPKRAARWHPEVLRRILSRIPTAAATQ